MSNIKTFTIFLIMLYCSSFVKGFKEWWEDTKVFELTNENFFDHVGKNKYVIVKFYTKWCGYCRIMAPEYDKFHESLLARDDVLVGRLEGSINEDISMIYEIYSFPKIVIFEPNSVDVKGTFTGKRVAKSLEKWVTKVAPKIDITKKIEKKEEEKDSKDIKDEKMGGRVIAKIEKKEENKTEEKKEEKKEECKKEEKKDDPKNTEDIEFVRRELDNMKNKVLNMEQEITSLKTFSKKLNTELDEAKSARLNQVKTESAPEKVKDDNSGLNDEMKIKLKAINDKKAKLADTYSIGDFILYFCIFLFFIGAIITIRKVFFMDNKTDLPGRDHPKA